MWRGIRVATGGCLTVMALSLGLGCGPSASPPGGDGQVIHITSREQFDELVVRADRPVLVDFFTTWCGPCQALAPRLEELSSEFAGRARFVAVDADKLPELRQQHRVAGYPTVIIFSGGQPQQTIVGLQDIAVYRNALNQQLAK